MIALNSQGNISCQILPPPQNSNPGSALPNISSTDPQQQPQQQATEDPTVPLSPQQYTNDQASQPHQAAPAPVKQEQNPWLTALVGQWSAFNQILKGYPLVALNIGQRLPLFWIVNFLLYSVVTGLFFSVSAGRVSSGFDGFVDDVTYSVSSGYYSDSNYFEIPFGTLFTIFCGGFFLAALILVLRALTLKWVLNIRGVKFTFAQAANNVAVAVSGQIIVLFAAFLLTLIPNYTFAAWISLFTSILLALLALVAELLLYISVNKEAPLEKSPLIPYVLMTAVWYILLAISFVIISSVFLEGIMG